MPRMFAEVFVFVLAYLAFVLTRNPQCPDNNILILFLVKLKCFFPEKKERGKKSCRVVIES